MDFFVVKNVYFVLFRRMRRIEDSTLCWASVFFLSFFLCFLRVFPTNTAPSSSSCRPSSFSPSQWVQPAPNTTGPLVMFGAAFDSRVHNHAVIIIELLVPLLRKGRVKKKEPKGERKAKQNKCHFRVFRLFPLYGAAPTQNATSNTLTHSQTNKQTEIKTHMPNDLKKERRNRRRPTHSFSRVPSYTHSVFHFL